MGGVSYLAAAFTQVIFESGTKGVLVPEGDLAAGDVPKPEKCVIDIGAASKKEAERRVRVGDCCALVPHLTRLTANRVCGRPLDDRIGCACLVEIAKRLTAPADDTYYVFSVQEEVGSRGARPAAFGIAPDVALIFDVTGTGDVPGAKPMAVKLGGGVAVKIRDSSVICHTGLVQELLELHYDPLYRQSQGLNYTGKRHWPTFETSDLSDAGIAEVAGRMLQAVNAGR